MSLPPYNDADPLHYDDSPLISQHISTNTKHGSDHYIIIVSLLDDMYPSIQIHLLLYINPFCIVVCLEVSVIDGMEYGMPLARAEKVILQF